MGSIYGRFFRLSTFGESHGPAVGVIVEGVPAGLSLTPEIVQSELDKRKPGLASMSRSVQNRIRLKSFPVSQMGRRLDLPSQC